MRETKIHSNISVVKNILNFSDDTIISKALAVKKEYLSFTYKNLIALINKAIAEGGEAFSDIKNALNSMSGEELDSFLFIPELSNKIYRRQDMTAIQKANYIVKMIDAVSAYKDEKFDYLKYNELWTGNGSHLFQYEPDDGSYLMFESPVLLNSVVLDFFSPYNRLISNRDCNVTESYEVGMYSFDESVEIVERTKRCITLIDPVIQKFIKHFTAVMLFKKFKGTANDRPLLFSATDGAFISRVIFGNSTDYYDEEYLDAIVHEAIHGLLFMIDELDNWMPNTKVSDKIGRIIVSPWTGNKLTLRNVLQAVFVWYGLYSFWQQHAPLFKESSFVKKRLKDIKKGFDNLDISVYGKEVPQITIDTIASVKLEVSSS